jgi:hypothetical protein
MPKSKDGCRYRGTEFSPKGIGLCAHLQPVGTRKEGRDGNIWIVKSDKNGTKRWFRETAAASSPKKRTRRNSIIQIQFV